METIFQFLFTQLRQQTRASERVCHNVASRLATEVNRICTESSRIQASGEVENWAKTLANHRLKQCLRYYKLGSKRGRVELQSLLSAIVYRYIAPTKGANSYQARVTLIEDFLQGFYAEALHNFRRENQLPLTYSPRTLLQLAEYMAFCERYAKRRIPLPGRRSQQLIILRSQTFSQKQPPETTIDMDSAAEGGISETDGERSDPLVQQLRAMLVDASNNEPDSGLRDTIIEQLVQYLQDRNQQDCIDYFVLRLKDLNASEIEDILGINSRQRDYLQQRFKYHLIRFALYHRWELVHQWLEADLEKNLGLTPQEWQQLQTQLTPQQTQLLQYKQQGLPTSEIAQALTLTVSQTEKQWFKLLEMAWEIRNRSVS
ncbi:heterocyst differentiation protein HetZ [Spirulina subsalsa FACHB-351]|uniref:Heterocyst differentiation protein HetZ n=1 Tax=Spirulina subsalsa FACHB-351 TaxID=234711 RepID=A0ABT3L2P5_9CYAN|nr:heterocyst differentiation protein HetZ [Spirulina subsalsa]MCW6035780.1 heterocyst differentiation protein HetZ [Spirulina subsalsa FACHB-351]